MRPGSKPWFSLRDDAKFQVKAGNSPVRHLGNVMSFRQFAIALSAAGGLVLALAAPAAAQSLPAAPGLPAAPALPGAPDMRPMWQGGASPAAALLPDARARDAWLSECHRRTTMYYDGYRKNRRSRDHARSDTAYSYCEAYFDDYYRTAGQHGNAHAYPVMAYAARPMMMAQAPVAQAASEPCEEIVTTTYEPVRSRVIPRRVAPPRRVPDKRIRVY